jgi:hypothetical protein
MVDRDESRSGSASRGLARLFAPPSCHSSASTPGHRCKQRWPSGQGFHPPTPVPPAWSLTTSTACSAPKPAGLLRPASDLGVRRVSYLPSRASEEAVGTGSGLPRSAVIPFKGFPSSAAVPHHCGRCPLAVAAYPNTPTGPAHRCALLSGVPPRPKAPRWAEVDDGGALVHRDEPPHRCRSVGGEV